jgi:hypothetical protein
MKIIKIMINGVFEWRDLVDNVATMVMAAKDVVVEAEHDEQRLQVEEARGEAPYRYRRRTQHLFTIYVS